MLVKIELSVDEAQKLADLFGPIIEECDCEHKREGSMTPVVYVEGHKQTLEERKVLIAIIETFNGIEPVL